MTFKHCACLCNLIYEPSFQMSRKLNRLRLFQVKSFKQEGEFLWYVYVSVLLSTCVRSALSLRSSTWPSRVFHQWESTPLNGPWGSALTPNKSETPLITQSRHYRTTLTSTTTQTTPKTWLHTIMYKWFVYMLAKTEKKAGKFKIDKSVWFFIFQIILWI